MTLRLIALQIEGKEEHVQEQTTPPSDDPEKTTTEPGNAGETPDPAAKEAADETVKTPTASDA